MVHASWYPRADRSQDRSQFAGIRMPRITKLLLHSTETQGWPVYQTFDPQFTYDPCKHLWRQHMALPLSASTLADPSRTAVRENRDDVVQVEIVGYCDPQRWPVYGKNVEKMDAQAITDLGEFAAWLADEWELPLKTTVQWVSYPKSYGTNAAQRLTGPQFDAYTGLLGHQHASGNSHGDPGRIDIAGILAAANGATPVAYPIPKTNDVYLSKLHVGQTDSDSVWQLENALNKLGATLTLDGDFSKATQEAWARAVFKAAGVDVDIINDL